MYKKKCSVWGLGLILCAGLAIFVPSAMGAVTVGGAIFPVQFQLGQTTLKLNGVGLRAFYHLVDGYATALYVVTPSHDPQTVVDGPNPKVIYTRFLRDASLERVRDEYQAIHQRYCQDNPCDARNEASFKAFADHISDARKGDVELVVITDGGVSLQRGGKVLVSVDDPAFGKGLVRSLVGSASPTQGYRDGLLGLSQ